MIGMMATVSKVLPDRGGVLVIFDNGVGSIDTGQSDGHFVRVLARRAHPTRGSVIELPEEGELGLVLELDNLMQFWVGGIYWQGNNQLDGTPLLSMSRDGSGVLRQTRQNGDVQFDHPSGLRVTVAAVQGPLAALGRTGQAGVEPPKGDCDIELEHPSGLKAHVDKDGALTLTLPAGGVISVDKDGAFLAQGFASMGLQDANARFCMEDLWTWAKDHKHTAQGATAITTIPTTQPPGSSLSPATMKGPHA
jgi:hypothetical protein